MTDPKHEVVTPQSSEVVFISHQQQMALGIQPIDRRTPKNDVADRAKAVKVFNIPIIFTMVEQWRFESFVQATLLRRRRPCGPF